MAFQQRGGKMRLVSILLLSFGFAAQAHIDPGTYIGTNDKGAGCSMKVIEQFYEGGLPHQLTEKIRIEIEGQEYLVGHPAVIDETADKVIFNHDRFQGLVPYGDTAATRGAKALIVEMSHDPAHRGPTEFKVMDHKWTQATAAVTKCTNLKLN